MSQNKSSKSSVEGATVAAQNATSEASGKAKRRVRKMRVAKMTDIIVLVDGTEITVAEAQTRFKPEKVAVPESKFDRSTYEILKTFMVPGFVGITKPKEFKAAKVTAITALGVDGHTVSTGRLLKQNLIKRVPITGAGTFFALGVAGKQYISDYEQQAMTAPIAPQQVAN